MYCILSDKGLNHAHRDRDLLANWGKNLLQISLRLSDISKKRKELKDHTIKLECACLAVS